MWGAIIGGALSLVGSSAQGDATKEASEAQGRATQAGIDETKREYDQSRTDLTPYRETGKAALLQLGDRLGLGVGKNLPTNDARYKAIYDRLMKPVDDAYRRAYGVGFNEYTGNDAAKQQDLAMVLPQIEAQFKAEYPGETPTGTGGNNAPLLRKFTLDDFNNDPVMQKSFEFGMSEGQKAVRRMFGARGLSRSGAAVKGATRFAEDYAGQQAGASRERYVADQTNEFNRLAAVSGIGQTAATTTGAMGANASTNVAGMLTAEGNARGAAAIARGNAMAGGVSGAANAINYSLDKAGRTPQVPRYNINYPYTPAEFGGMDAWQ